MSKQEYYLVNPLIGGNIKTKFSGKNDIDAAKKAYDTLSEYFNNNVPEFHFTLQQITTEKTQVGGGKITDYKHFKTIENKKGSQVDFRLVPFKVTKNGSEMKNFREQIKKLDSKVQLGGHNKKYDDEDWIDDSDDEYFPRLSRNVVYSNPLSYWWYDPYVFRIQKYYVPTFVAPIAPYIQIPLYFS